MQLKDILPQSAYCSIATITGEESIEKAYGFVQTNKYVIRQFPHIILCYNYMEDVSDETRASYERIWLNEFPKATILPNHVNEGHMKGTIDLEEQILRYIKFGNERLNKRIKYMWKSTEDVLIYSSILDVKVEPAEFYYLPGFSYESLQRYKTEYDVNTIPPGKSLERAYFQYFCNTVPSPQTNFYIIDVTKIDTLYGEDVDDKWASYLLYKQSNPDTKPWDIPFSDGIKFACEELLGHTVKGLVNVCILPDRVFYDLIRFVLSNKIADPSHKNILLYDVGICHLHYPEEGVYTI